MSKENVLIFCAHSDDETIAMGGTIAKYSKEGKKVVVVIFSLGEASNPILQQEVIVNLRIREAEKVKKALGIKEVIFLGIPDNKVDKNINNGDLINSIKAIIDKHKPTKIFTHALADPHADHRGVNKIVTKILNLPSYKDYSLYTFDVWNPINIFNKRNVEKLVVDISDTFKTKLEALKLFKSQKIQGAYTLLPTVILKAKTEGINNDCQYAEKFFKVK